MKSIPFYIGVLFIIPVAVQAQADTRKKLPNGYGVGSVMTADIAILHESIKENIQQQALLVWIDAQGRKATHQAAQEAIDAIVNNIRYVSIENTWYKIIREVSKTSLLSKAIAGAGARALVKHNGVRSVTATQRQGAYPDCFTAPVAGTELPPYIETEQQKVVVTVFANEPDLTGELRNQQLSYQGMAIIVDRYQQFDR